MPFNKENFFQEGNSEEFFFARTNPLANAANAEILKIEDCGGCCDIQLDMYIGTVEGTTTVEFNTPTDDYDTKYIKVQITDGQGNFVTAVGTGLVDELVLDTSGLNGYDWSVIIEISIGESDLLGCDCTKKFSFGYDGGTLSIDTEALANPVLSLSAVGGALGITTLALGTFPDGADIPFQVELHNTGFTVSEYSTINGSSTNYTSTIAGVTNFTYQIIAGQPDSVTYYVVCPGDANGTGYNRARLTPIQIVNPNNANKHIIDVTTAYDNILETIEVNYPKLGVDAGDVVRIPVKLKTGGINLGSLQICMKYDSTLLTFKGVKNEMKTSYWISFINTSNNMVEWGGYDPSNNQHLVNDGDLFFTLEFESKKPQNEWGKSPLYVQRKFAGNPLATDLNITPTDGIIQVFRMGGTTNNFKDMILYPNPFEGDVTIGFKIYKEGKNIIGIYDINGKQQMEIVANETKIGIYSNTVDLSFLPPGTYLAVLRNEEKTTTKKAVKTK